MGCNLKDLVRPESINLNDLEGERVAIDVFLSAYQFITAMTGEDGRPLSRDGKPVAHIMGFLDRATTLIAAGIDPVFVFDGRPHNLKQDTLRERRERKENAKTRWNAAVEEGDMKAAKKIGPPSNWSEYTIFMDDDWSMASLVKNYNNIWIPNIHYVHPNPRYTSLRKPGTDLRYVEETAKKFQQKWGFNPDGELSDEELESMTLKYSGTHVETVMNKNTYDWNYLK